MRWAFWKRAPKHENPPAPSLAALSWKDTPSAGKMRTFQDVSTRGSEYFSLKGSVESFESPGSPRSIDSLNQQRSPSNNESSSEVVSGSAKQDSSAEARSRSQDSVKPATVPTPETNRSLTTPAGTPLAASSLAPIPLIGELSNKPSITQSIPQRTSLTRLETLETLYKNKIALQKAIEEQDAKIHDVMQRLEDYQMAKGRINATFSTELESLESVLQAWEEDCNTLQKIVGEEEKQENVIREEQEVVTTKMTDMCETELKTLEEQHAELLKTKIEAIEGITTKAMTNMESDLQLLHTVQKELESQRTTLQKVRSDVERIIASSELVVAAS